MLITRVFTNSKNNRKKRYHFFVSLRMTYKSILISSLRAFASANSTLSYFTILKSQFINYTISFYNTSSIPTFIFLFYSLKKYIYTIKYIFPFFVFSQFSPPPSLNLYHRASIAQSPPLHLHHAHHATTAHCPPKSHWNKNPYYKIFIYIYIIKK